MDTIEVLGGVKLEPKFIKVEPDGRDAVEIGMDDVFNSSDEYNEDSKDNGNVSYKGIKDKPQLSESKYLKNAPASGKRKANAVRSQVKIGDEGDENRKSKGNEKASCKGIEGILKLRENKNINKTVHLKEKAYKVKAEVRGETEGLGGVKVKLEPTLTKIEREGDDAVEIGIDDVFSSSDEENQNFKENECVSSKATEGILNPPEAKNLNEPVGGKKANEVGKQVMVDDAGENGVCKEFSDACNLEAGERLVLNSVKRVYKKHKKIKNVKNPEKIKNVDNPEVVDWAQVYRTSEGTSYRDEENKITVTRASSLTTYVAPHEYKILASDKYVCNQCQFATKTLKLIKKHIRAHHRKTPTMYHCPFCPYKSKWNLKYHIIFNHKNDEDIHWFRCHICNMKFKMKTALSRHMISHFTPEQLNESLKKCAICGKVFKTGHDLRRHVRFIHNKEIKKRYQCNQCSFSTQTSKLLTEHVEVQHNHSQQLQIYKCNRCAYKTRYTSRFKAHNKKHEASYCCEKCAFIARTGHQLRLHQLTHQIKIEDRDLKYRCDKCDYKTYRTYSLTIHKLNHLRPDEIEYFYCYHCSFKAKRKDNLKTHVLKHFKKNEVTLQCFVCDFSTKQRHLLISHINKHSKVQIHPQVSES